MDTFPWETTFSSFKFYLYSKSHLDLYRVQFLRFKSAKLFAVFLLLSHFRKMDSSHEITELPVHAPNPVFEYKIRVVHSLQVYLYHAVS